MTSKPILLDFDDLLIEPAYVSPINSRSECNPFYNNGSLPLMTAPMDTVLNMFNAHEFIRNNITAILPRGERDHDYTMNEKSWFSYGLQEFSEIFLNEEKHLPINKSGKIYALIDVANGHMKQVEDLVNAAKNKYGSELVLMVGNVANPKAYYTLSVAGADFIRVGIGNGGGCLTTEQTGVGYPMASLIQACRIYKEDSNLTSKIVADGGMKKYADVIKALACGADYVMIGSIFNKALESAGGYYFSADGRSFNSVEFDSVMNERMDQRCLYKKFRGMSTKEVQTEWGKEVKTSEGVVKFQLVEYTLKGWVDNFTHYLKSAMSYTASKDLNDFIGGVELNKISENAFKRYNK